MVFGRNQDIAHRGRVFHVQTEDLGRSRACIVSYIFFSGDTLVAHRQPYTTWEHNCDQPQQIRAAVEEQHAAMVQQLLSGGFDAQLR